MDWINADNLQPADVPRIAFISVSNAIDLLWEQNPKMHDLGGVIESIKKYGFQELPKFDIQLTNVRGEKGAIKAGNGRVEALYAMAQDKRYDLPRGITTIKDTGEWAIPIVVGVDAESVNAAIAYAIDSNNLTMAGGDFNIYDLTRMWDSSKYISLLRDLAQEGETTISLDKADVDALVSNYYFDENTIPDLSEHDDEMVGEKRTFTIVVGNPVHLETILQKVRQLLEENNDWEAHITL